MPETVARKMLRPIERFMQLEAAGGITLLIAAAVAMIWANSPLSELYQNMLHMHVGFSLGPLHLEKSLHHWVNDGLMVIFFFVVGLEIKGELVHGELSSPKKAALPLFAAFGGMVAPALIYVLFNYSLPDGKMAGWGIPMATDIAFAVGILSLLGKRVPLALKIFLLALAIVDDLGAVLVIAFFYTSEISSASLGIAAISFIFMILANLIGVRALWVYLILGVCAWLGVLQSGVHATIAGVILGLITPTKEFIKTKEFGKQFDELSSKLKKQVEHAAHNHHEHTEVNSPNAHDLSHLRDLAYESMSPLKRMIHSLHPWVTYFIMPVFALFNAGVVLKGMSLGDAVTSPVSLGVLFGLVLGKPIGIFLFSFLSVKLKLADLPKGTNWMQVLGLGCLGGIGFTMALFICNLALTGSIYESYAKLAILSASLLATIAGFAILHKSCPEAPNKA